MHLKAWQNNRGVLMNRTTAVNLVLVVIGAAALFTLFNQGMKLASKMGKPKASLPGGKLDLGNSKATALSDLQSQISKGLGKLADAEDDVALQPPPAVQASAPAPPAPIVIVRYVYVNQPAAGTISVPAQVATLPGVAAGTINYPGYSSAPRIRLPLDGYPPPTSLR